MNRLSITSTRGLIRHRILNQTAPPRRIVESSDRYESVDVKCLSRKGTTMHYQVHDQTESRQPCGCQTAILFFRYYRFFQRHNITLN